MNYVYIFKNYYDEVIYVGKTKDIKRRMNEHFTRGHLPEECYQEVKNIKYAEVGISLYDAEIIETILIDQYKPIYNTEKVFKERAELTQYKIPELKWKNIYIEKNDEDLKVSFNEIKKDVYNLKLTETERVDALIKYNLNKLKYKRGFYKYYFNELFEKNEFLFDDLRAIYLYAYMTTNIFESSVDECISNNQEEICIYASFNIKETNVELKSMNSLFLAVKHRFIFKINDDLYGIPLHSDENLKIMSSCLK